MADFIPVLSLDELPVGSAKEVTAAGRVFALFHVDETIYALDGVCPHAGGPLGKGELNGNIVTCPWHGWQFDVTTGTHCLTPNICQTSFPLKIDDGQICVQIPD